MSKPAFYIHPRRASRKMTAWSLLIASFWLLVFWWHLLLSRLLPADKNSAAVEIPESHNDPKHPFVKKALAKGNAVKLHLAGCPNLHQVSPVLYRGGQPTREGFLNLKKIGVRTIISLRSFHCDRDLLDGTGLQYTAMPVDTWDVHPDDLTTFFESMARADYPVYLHCLHGSDRTGAMVAAYRILEQGWDTEKAVREMTHGGYGFHRLWRRLPHVVRNFDYQAIRRYIQHL